jgi:acyl-coenzyme A thioesterase PaaI-like protein
MVYHNSIPWICGDVAGGGGLALDIDWDDEEGVVQLVMPRATQAAPGVAHGGCLSAIADHVMGFVAAQRTAGPVATRQLVVDYLVPTPTSSALTIRARADEVSAKTVTVTLRCLLDASGKLTFTATGSYARVSLSKRSSRADDADYDTLEQRFDPSQVFAWLTAALREAYVPGAMSRPLLIALELSDTNPRCWTVRAAADSLSIEAGEPTAWDVRFAGTVRSWRELVYRVHEADQLTAAGSATFEDPDGLLPAFLGSLAT